MLQRMVGQCWHCGQSGVYQCGCCTVCFQDLPRAPPRNLRPAQALDYCRTWLAAMYYQAPIDYWMYQYKFYGQYNLAQAFAPLISAQVLAFHKATQRCLPSVLVPVPMSNARWRRRGYNQARTLCQAISCVLGIPFVDSLVVNPRAPALIQHRLSAREREQTLSQRFLVRQVIDVSHVAVIDDVITTGSTLNAAALALLEAGVDEVSGWALAYTPAQVTD